MSQTFVAHDSGKRGELRGQILTMLRRYPIFRLRLRLYPQIELLLPPIRLLANQSNHGDIYMAAHGPAPISIPTP